MYIISFDCGIKNFAYSCIELLHDNNLTINPIDDFFHNNEYKIIDIQNINIYDIKCNKTVKSKKNSALHAHVVTLLLDVLDKLNKSTDIKILIEYQMNINYKANIIYNVIITFFETYYKINKKTNYEIVTIQPSYKNNISQHIDIDNTIRIKYINQYKYNKKIVELYFISLNDKFNFLNLKPLKKIDDISDSFIQILSYIYYY